MKEFIIGRGQLQKEQKGNNKEFYETTIFFLKTGALLDSENHFFS